MEKERREDSGRNELYHVTPPATLADNGSLFAVVVSNSAGRVTSRNAQLIVTSTSRNSDRSVKSQVTAANTQPVETTSSDP